MTFILDVPVVHTISSCLAFYERDESIWLFLDDMNTSLQEFDKKRGDQRQMWKTVLRMLRMEGIEDVMEEKLRNDKKPFLDDNLLFNPSSRNPTFTPHPVSGPTAPDVVFDDADQSGRPSIDLPYPFSPPRQLFDPQIEERVIVQMFPHGLLSFGLFGSAAGKLETMESVIVSAEKESKQLQKMLKIVWTMAEPFFERRHLEIGC
ncbi:hypothetical protein BLNAU_23106 [Blattamonas nauphoetae]|uniref:Uncharacterized protein n=1 Tax=Blattamonas nauphoetae TaxID=2049346 RepID=A0ABQ9WRN1_9EUKA|nr:hypothetical protein BLNAU_23106 [Blattamonas nauphoetae]